VGSRTVLRWALALAVLVLAAAVALWPRDSGGGLQNPGAPPPDLTSLRERAALADCPAPRPGAAAAGGVLSGIAVPCLGDGGTVAMGTALAGRETLLSLWSHTCAPCRDELPALQEYAARPGAVPVLGVQVDGSPQAGLALLTALGVHLPSVADPDGAVRAALSAPDVLPLAYLVAADGSVRMINPPVVFRSADEVDAVVKQYRAGV
jgi:thiol-disulfide isomerase/thioredoxin